MLVILISDGVARIGAGLCALRGRLIEEGRVTEWVRLTALLKLLKYDLYFERGRLLQLIHIPHQLQLRESATTAWPGGEHRRCI